MLASRPDSALFLIERTRGFLSFSLVASRTSPSPGEPGTGRGPHRDPVYVPSPPWSPFVSEKLARQKLSPLSSNKIRTCAE